MFRAMTVPDADAAPIRRAFAAQTVVTDPLPSALRVTEADMAAHMQRGGGGGCGPGGAGEFEPPLRRG